MDPARQRAHLEHLLTRGATRRRLLAAGLSGAALATGVSLRGRPTRSVLAQATPGASPVASPVASPALAAGPFALGVASGDPTPDGVVIWTRLAPDPLAEDGAAGMDGQGPVEVRWEVATEEGFGQVARAGRAVARPELGHSVHVDVTGLDAGASYFYRFTVGGEVSPTGRTKTAPAAGEAVDRLRFAVASCSHWEHGRFTAYRHLAAEDLDLVLHLGDYLYEYPSGEAFQPSTYASVREHVGPETVTLTDYRRRHAQYKTDPDLQAAHAAFPWVLTWDDHEAENNYAAAISEDGLPPELFLGRRAAAYQAYYEHMPLRPGSLPQGAAMQLYRRLPWGTLAEFSVLDTRQYRSDHPCGDGIQVRCPAALDPSATLTGPAQERWLLEGLDASASTWNVLAQQTMMAQLEVQPDAAEQFPMDQWDGYPAARNRLLSRFANGQIANPVVITGDWHCAFVNDLKLDFADPDSPTVASEFVVTSISAQGDSTGYGDYYGPMIPWNPHIQYFADRRGYQTVDLTPELWRTDLHMVSTVTSEDATVETVASFVVEDGVPGPQPA